jgi:hypothetical protein
VLRREENGSLARSTEFMRTYIDVLHMAVNPIGGYNSENNEMFESPIKQVNSMIQVFLIGSAMLDIIW